MEKKVIIYGRKKQQEKSNKHIVKSYVILRLQK